jgi:hypothetical protein
MDKSLIHILRKECGIFSIHQFSDMKIPGLVNEKYRRVILTQISFLPFRTCFTLYDGPNYRNLPSPSLWPVWFCGLFGQVFFPVRISLDLKWNKTGDASLQEHNSLQQRSPSAATGLHKSSIKSEFGMY